MKPWLKNRKYRVYLKTVTRDPSGALEKPGNQDPKKSGKPGTWKNRKTGTLKNWKTGTLAGP